MTKHARWTPEMIATVLRTRDSGGGSVEAARELGVSRWVVNRARRRGVVDWPVTDNRVEWTPEMIKIAVDMRAARRPIAEILVRLGVSEGAFTRARETGVIPGWRVPKINGKG